MALLVLLATAAWTRRVPWDLVAERLLGVAGLPALPDGLSRAAGAGGDIVPVLLHPLDPGRRRRRRLILPHQLDPVDVLHEVLLDRLRELIEHHERLALILGEGVPLGVRTQVDPFLEIVHLVQVLT